VNGFRGFLLIAKIFDMHAMKIYIHHPAEIMSLLYSPHCLGMNPDNIPSRWCLRVMKENWQKFLHSLENLRMKRLNKI
jgi:hypothetical protein